MEIALFGFLCAIRLGTFCRKNCRRKSMFIEDFYACDFLMVHQFQCFISLETTKTSLILIKIEENWVLWWKLVANRIYLSAHFRRLVLEPQDKSSLLPLSTNSDFSVSVSDVNKACFADLISLRLRISHYLDSCVKVLFSGWETVRLSS